MTTTIDQHADELFCHSCNRAANTACVEQGHETTMTGEQCADDCHFGDHDEPPAPRAGEREHIKQERERVPPDVLTEMRGLAENWNSKSRLEQIIARHRIHGLSGIPNSEYSCSWQDVRLLIIEHNQHATLVEQRERLVHVLSMITCNGCHNRIGWNETPTKYGDWTKCSSCRAARELLATIEQEGDDRNR